MTIDELITRARAAYGFRDKRPTELDPVYLAALVAHVESRDFAAAHELRVGRAQADWTPGDVADFRERMIARYAEGKPPKVRSSISVLPVIELARWNDPIDEAAIVRLAEAGMRFFQQMRSAKPPSSPMPIMVNVLTTDGRVLVATVTDRGDRVETVRSLVETLPVFGFFVLCDVFVHGITDERAPRQSATKIDALIAHVGTREMRRLITRPYHFDEAGRVVFHAAAPDIDKRGHETLNDPYADVFAVPGPTRPQ